MKRKVYHKPTVDIVVLTHQDCLLQVSGGNSSTQDYIVNKEQDI